MSGKAEGIKRSRYVLESGIDGKLRKLADFVDSKIESDVQDASLFYYDVKGRVFAQFSGNLDHKFVMIHVFGDMEKFTSYEVYDKESETLDYGKL